VILPDSHQTTYAYSVENGADWKGTVTTITDPLSKQCSASAEIGVSVR
jgi:hypothetical protein